MYLFKYYSIPRFTNCKKSLIKYFCLVHFLVFCDSDRNHLNEAHLFYYSQTKKYYHCYLLLLFFLDHSLPLSRLIILNPYGKFKLKQDSIFKCGFINIRSIILKEGVSNVILEMFVFLLTFEVIIIILFVFIFHKGRRMVE
jgi:hypothetical protein